MEKGLVQVFNGNGCGKSSAALGKALQAAAAGKNVVVIQFLKGSGLTDSGYLQRLEPEIKIFRFEKFPGDFNELPPERKTEEINNIRNGLNFAKKVLTTGECKMLILDEVLGLIDNDIMSIEDLKALIDARDEETDIIMTGIAIDDKICRMADEVNRIETVK